MSYNIQRKQLQTPLSASYALTASYVPNASSFPFTGSAVITGSLVVTGSIRATTGFTGSLFGTASWAQNSTNALIANSALNASRVLVYPSGSLNGFRPLLIPENEVDENGDYTNILETSILYNPAKNLVRFITSNGEEAKLEIGNPSEVNSGALIVYGDVWHSGLNVLPNTIKFVDSLDTGSAQILTSLSYIGNRLILSSGSYSGSFSGSLFGTASWAQQYNEIDPIFIAKSASLATTGSNIFIGNQGISGSLNVSGSFKLLVNTVAPVNPPSDNGLFYFTSTDLYVSLD